MDILLNGVNGRLEGRYEEGTNNKAVLFLHPHPYYGGNMNNKPLYLMYKLFHNQGFSVLRFNLIGKNDCIPKMAESSKQYATELANTAMVLDWMQQHWNSSEYWVVGLSFGAWLGLQLIMRRPEIKRFVFVNLPVNLFEMNFLQPTSTKGLMVQSELDQITDEKAVVKYVQVLEQLGMQITYVVCNSANHFFTNHLKALENIISQYVVLES